VRTTEVNQTWSLDFEADQLTDGRRFRALTIVDVFTRESVAIEGGAGVERNGCGGSIKLTSIQTECAEDSSQ
jgi:hypothetical protein